MTARGNAHEKDVYNGRSRRGRALTWRKGELAVDFDGREIKLEEATLHGRLAIAAETALLSPSRTLVGSVRSERRPNRLPLPKGARDLLV
jgi:hypothetical protein